MLLYNPIHIYSIVLPATSATENERTIEVNQSIYFEIVAMDLESNNSISAVSGTFKPPIEEEQNVQDATDLAAMGHAQALTRKFDTWSMLSLAFCVLGMQSNTH